MKRKLPYCTFCEICKHMFDSLIKGSGIISSFKCKPKSLVIRPPVVELWIHHCVLDILFYNTTEHHLKGGEKIHYNNRKNLYNLLKKWKVLYKQTGSKDVTSFWIGALFFLNLINRHNILMFQIRQKRTLDNFDS